MPLSLEMCMVLQNTEKGVINEYICSIFGMSSVRKLDFTTHRCVSYHATVCDVDISCHLVCPFVS